MSRGAGPNQLAAFNACDGTKTDGEVAKAAGLVGLITKHGILIERHKANLRVDVERAAGEAQRAEGPGHLRR